MVNVDIAVEDFLNIADEVEKLQKHFLTKACNLKYNIKIMNKINEKIIQCLTK